MNNIKSIFKKLVCPDCKKWTPDETGKLVVNCPHCHVRTFPSVKWYVRLTHNGKTTLRAISSRRQEAVDYLHAAKDAARKGQLLPGEEKPITWVTAGREFEKWIVSGNLANNTREFYRNGYKHLDSFFSKDLQDITVRQVEEYRDNRKASPKTVSEEIKTLKRIYSLFCRWNSARVSPSLHAVAADLAKVEMPRYNNKRTRFLSESEVALMLDTCAVPHLKLAIQIALGTGLRLSNIMSLEWKQIDFINRSITFKPEDMKSKRLHVSPLMGQLSTLLCAHRVAQGRISPYVFPSPTCLGKAMSSMQTSWNKLMTDCNKKLASKKLPLLGDDVVWHTSRHTFASHFLMNGGDLSTLSELLGHASIQVTKDRYGHLSGEFKRDSIDKFEHVFFKMA